MSQQKDFVSSIQSARVNVGLSALVGITVGPSQSGLIVDYISGGSLLIGGESMTGASTGFLIKDGLPFSGSMVGTVYLLAVGSTAIAQWVKGIT